MLGLKGVLAKADRTPTLIFDEIDQGIGGRVGAVVGEKLRGLARGAPGAVRHAPAPAGGLCRSALTGWRSTPAAAGRPTQVRTVVGDERVAELAQMLGGDSESNRLSAAELVQAAQASKDSR